MAEAKVMRAAPRSYSPSVDVRVSNVPRQDLPSRDCWALSGVAIRHAEPKTEAIAMHFFMPSARLREENRYWCHRGIRRHLTCQPSGLAVEQRSWGATLRPALW